MTQPDLFQVDRPMYALTVCQPWAYAIVAGHKRLENRSWGTAHRGPLLIHAGLSRQWMDEGTEFLRAQGIEPPDDLAFGAILGQANVVDVRPVAECRSDPYAFGPLCWVLDCPLMLPQPVPFAGKQGLWRVPTGAFSQ